MTVKEQAMSKAFMMPFSNLKLIKASEEKGEPIVYLEASNEGLDREGERILRKALEDQKDEYLKSGLISYDHRHLTEGNPSYIIGEPLDVQFSNDNRTLVKGKLYKENTIVKGIWENLLSGSSRFGASVGGYVLNKGGDGTIDKVLWTETAITPSPVNADTLGHVTLLKPKEFAKSLRGLDSSVGGELGQPLQVNVRDNALMNQGGDALPAEKLTEGVLDAFLDGEKMGMEIHSAQEAVDLFTNMWVSVMMSEIKTHGDLVTWMLKRGYSYPFSEYTANYVARNLPTVLQTLSVPYGRTSIATHGVSVG